MISVDFHGKTVQTPGLGKWETFQKHPCTTGRKSGTMNGPIFPILYIRCRACELVFQYTMFERGICYSNGHYWCSYFLPDGRGRLMSYMISGSSVTPVSPWRSGCRAIVRDTFYCTMIHALLCLIAECFKLVAVCE